MITQYRPRTNDGSNFGPNFSFASVGAKEPASAGLSNEAREYFRVDTEVFLLCRPFSAATGEPPMSATKVNLSGGGVSFVPSGGHLFLKVGQLLRLEILLTSSSGSPAEINCLGEVVRVTDQGQEPMVGLRFARINNRDRDRIVGHCFSVQSQMLRRKVRVS